MTDWEYLHIAYACAQQAYRLDEVPVGAIVVHNQRVIGQGFNQKETHQQAYCHAECMAIIEASRVLKTWRLLDCDLYSTLEPCPMCAGLIMQSRLRRVVYGAKDRKWGAVGSVVDLSVQGLFNHSLHWEYQEHPPSSEILKTFFKQKR